MLVFFWGLQLRRVKRYFQNRITAKLITAALFIAVFCAVALGIYEFFLQAFLYLNGYPFFREALTLYAFELFFLLSSFLLWLGALISLLFGLFKNSSQSWIVASPKFGFLPAYALSSAALSSAWLLVFVLFPALLAAARVFGFGFWGWGLSLLGALALAGLMIALAYILIFLTARVLLWVRAGVSMAALSAVLGAVVLAVFLLAASRIVHHDVVALLSADNLSLVAAPVAPVEMSFRGFPSTLAAGVVSAVQAGKATAAAAKVGELLLLLILATAAAAWLTGSFLLVWQKLAEGRAPLSHSEEPRRQNSKRRSPFLGSRFGVVVYKESRLLFRNVRNIFWLLFLMLMWLSYIGFNFSVQNHLEHYNDSLAALPRVVLAVQLLILVYFVSALALRFIFPSFSAERNTAWIFASSPLSLPKLFWSKYAFFTLTFGAFAGLAEAVNVLFLKLPAGSAGLFLALSLAAVVFICAFGLYLGARFPNFETDDPETLSTSIPGLFLVFGSIAYGSLSAYIYFAYLSGVSPGFPIIFILVSLLAAAIFAQNGAAAIKRVDFIPSSPA